MDIKNKVALITGGARIGITVAEELAKAGAHVAMSYRHSKDAALAAAERVKLQGVESLILKGDVTKSSQVKKIVQSVIRRFGRLDILVNMASIYEATPLDKISESDWEINLAANLKSAHLCALAASSFMKKNGGGRIINFADWTAASGRPRYKNLLPYYVSKSGVVGLTEILALELAPEILVNCIAPGPILPPAKLSPKEYKEVIKATPLKKWGGAMAIARAVLFLAQTDFVTGETLRVDGGRHLL